MGRKDITTKLLTKDNEVFAEIFNKFLLNEEVINPDDLIEKDITELTATAEKLIVEQKFRDILKSAEIRIDDHSAYLLLGIENQSEIHYSMVIRTMLYDALNYSDQTTEAGKQMRKGKTSKYTYQEWLSRFPKDKKIIPVITLVLCWKPEKWEAPRSLFEMMDPDVVHRFGKWINNYTLNLVSVYDLPDEVLRSTRTDIGLALEFSKYSRDKEKIKEFANDSRFENRSNTFVATINQLTETKFSLNPTGGTVNMCEGIRLMQEEIAEEVAKETENEDIKKVFTALREQSPDVPVSSTIKFLANTFKRSQKSIRALVL